MGMRLRHAAMLGVFVALAAAAAPLAGDPVRVPDAFDSEKQRHRVDSSGIACRPDAGPAVRHCLVVDDERQFIRAARLADGALTFTGAPVPIVRDSGPVDPDVVGSPPAIACGGGKGDKPFDNFDGEGIALAPDGAAYVVGSHGCSRSKDRYAAGSFLLSRLTPTPGGGWSVRQTYRLAEALRAAPVVGSFVGRSLNQANGLNIEGIAVLGGDLLVGLRAPVLNGEAQVVRIPLAPLFASGPLPPVPAPIALPLGADTGIRDLTVTRDGRLLVLAGPAQEQEQEQAVAYTLWLADAETGRARKLAELAPVTTSVPACLKAEDRATPGKAEGVTILEESPDALRVLVLFDGLCDGEPRLYTLPR